jgi:hypothetical protein
MANVVEVIIKASDQTGGALSKLNSSFKSLTGFSMGAAGGIALATKAIQAGIEYTKEAIEANDKYVTSIVDMARFTGDEVDAMSRLVQVADDVFLSQEALNNAMSIGAKKGLDMSVQGIKDLADQYNALGTQQEKNLLLNENFGRSGIAMGKLLEQGADGITSQMNAIADNLVVTKDSVKITYDYKRSVDSLNDALDGLEYTVAQQAMPALTDLNVVLSELATNVAENDTGLEKYLKVYTTYFPNIYSLLRLGVKGIEDWAGSIESANGIYDELATSQIEGGATFVDSAYGFVYSADIITSANEEIAESLLGIKEQYNSVSSLAGSLTEADEKLLQAETDLAQYIKDNPWDTKGIQERKDKINELKDEQQSMVDSWLLNVYTQMITADGDLSESDMNFLLQFQVNAGMITQANADKAQSYWDFANDSMAANEALQASIDSMRGKEITITTIYNSLTSGGTSPTRAAQIAAGIAAGNVAPTNPTRYASGGSFTVPSWAGYEGFNMGGAATASAGEVVNISRKDNMAELLSEMQGVRRGLASLPRELSVAIVERVNQLGQT